MNFVGHKQAQALIRWQHVAGPFWPYVGAAPFLNGLPLALEGATTKSARLARRLAESIAASCHDGDGAAIFIDLALHRTLPAAPALGRAGFWIVPVVQRWVAAAALLPCDLLVMQLITCVPRVSRAPMRGVVFLLDGERAGHSSLGYSRKARLFDNRYRYSINGFPQPVFLRKHGITRVRWLSPSGVAPDLQPYASVLAEADLVPEVSALQPS